jgi:hypothetical protein
MQHKAFLKLLGLQYKIVYKKGKYNKAADALSRNFLLIQLSVISASTPKWLEVITEAYLQDPEAQTLLAELAITGSNQKGYSLHDGIIKYKGKIWLGHHKEAQHTILQALHNSGVGGHSGITTTYHKVRSLFTWPGLKQSVHSFVTQCQVCQQAKPEHTKLPGLLHPHKIPMQAWHTISLDFIEELPKSNQYDSILVIVDKFTKYGHFIPLKHPYTALTIAQLFINHIYRLHGLPEVIISDRDKVLTSALWQELFRLSDTILNMSSSYHPQTDG